MKICEKCSVANDDKAVFCTGCGAVLPNNTDANEQMQADTGSANPVNTEPNTTGYQQTDAAAYAQAQPQYSQANPPYVQSTPPFVQPVYSQPAQSQMSYSPQYGFVNESMLPPEYQPVTMWQYVGYTLLFSLPIIGIIMILVTAFGSDKCVSLRNYAKSFLIMYAIGFIMAWVIFFFIGLLAVSIGASPY